MLSFSADGADDFAEREMKEDPAVSGVYIAEIPASATQGGVVDYFIEALGDNDTLVAAKGSANKTLKITMLGRTGSRWSVGRQEEAAEEGRSRRTSRRAWFFGLGVGSGVGWATGNGEVNDRDKVDPPGFAMSQLLHFAPEVGYFVSPEFLLSVQLRFQLISGAHGVSRSRTRRQLRRRQSARRAATRSRASRGRRYFFGEGDFRTYVAGIGGLGHDSPRRIVRVAARLRPEHDVDLHRHRPVGAGVRRARAPASCTT